VHAQLAREVLELDCSPEEEQRLLQGATYHKMLRAGPRLFVFGEQVAQLVERLQAAQLGDRPFVVRPSNLEDLFLATTGTQLEGGA
jgi:hypothetical protein